MDPHNDHLKPRYHRVVLKLSGEAFGSPGINGISIDETISVAREAQRIVQRGVQLAIVVGAGNILRGAQFSSGGVVIKQGTAHYMGMLATVLNGLALQDALEHLACETRLMTAIRMETVAEPLHPPTGHPSSGKGPGRHPGRRHRQPLCHHRHRSGPPLA